MELQYVASCWRYDRLLTLSLSQFVLHPPREHTVTVTVCYCRAADTLTADVLDFFAANYSPANVVWDWQDYEQRRLMRRAISRNEICRSTVADFVLLADIDYMPGTPDCLDETADAMIAATDGGGRPWLMHPQFVMSSRSHSTGNAEIARVKSPKIYELATAYDRSSLPRAIGGTQWITGDMAREFGYLPDSKRFQRPAATWKRTYCDCQYRKSLAASGIFQKPLAVEGWHRVRHEKRGRFDIGVRL